MICSLCKSTDNIMPSPYKRYKKLDGTDTVRYMCRDCNTRRAKKYRATENGKKLTLEAIRNHHRQNKVKVHARYLARRNLKAPEMCEKCEEFKALDAHHDDYSKPLEVQWLCRQCHANVHQLIMV